MSGVPSGFWMGLVHDTNEEFANYRSLNRDTDRDFALLWTKLGPGKHLKSQSYIRRIVRDIISVLFVEKRG